MKINQERKLTKCVLNCRKQPEQNGTCGGLRGEQIRLKNRPACGSKRNKKRQIKKTTTRRYRQTEAKPRRTVVEILTENQELQVLFDRATQIRRQHLQNGVMETRLSGFYAHQVYPSLARVFRTAMLDAGDQINVESVLYHQFVEGERL